MGPNLPKGHLWDSLDKIEDIYWDTSRQIFTLSLINQIVCNDKLREWDSVKGRGSKNSENCVDFIIEIPLGQRGSCLTLPQPTCRS